MNKYSNISNLKENYLHLLLYQGLVIIQVLVSLDTSQENVKRTLAASELNGELSSSSHPVPINQLSLRTLFGPDHVRLLASLGALC